MLAADMVYVGDKQRGRRHGKGACMTLRVRETYQSEARHAAQPTPWCEEDPEFEAVVSCYDGEWVRDRFTGRGYAKHQNGDYEDGMFCDGVLYDGFRVSKGEVQTIKPDWKRFVDYGAVPGEWWADMQCVLAGAWDSDACSDSGACSDSEHRKKYVEPMRRAFYSASQLIR